MICGDQHSQTGMKLIFLLCMKLLTPHAPASVELWVFLATKKQMQARSLLGNHSMSCHLDFNGQEPRGLDCLQIQVHCQLSLPKYVAARSFLSPVHRYDRRPSSSSRRYSELLATGLVWEPTEEEWRRKDLSACILAAQRCWSLWEGDP